jgi:hypothetical protein
LTPAGTRDRHRQPSGPAAISRMPNLAEAYERLPDRSGIVSFSLGSDD